MSLRRWFQEKWVDTKTGKPCGRQKGEKRKGYPACRPSRRVSSKTPKTTGEMSKGEKARFNRTKTSSKRIGYNHSRRKKTVRSSRKKKQGRMTPKHGTGLGYMRDTNDCNLRISWHQVHKSNRLRPYREVQVLPSLLARAQYAGYLEPSRRWDRPQKWPKKFQI